MGNDTILPLVIYAISMTGIAGFALGQLRGLSKRR